MTEVERRGRALTALQVVWMSIQAGTDLPIPPADFYITTGWASGDSAATAVDWSSDRPIVRVNLGTHEDGKALLVELLHMAAHAVAQGQEVEDRRKRASTAHDIAVRLSAGQRVPDIAAAVEVSEGTVYRHKATIEQTGLIPDENEDVSLTGATGGAYHSAYFREAAESLGLKVSQKRLPGRGHEIIATQPLASGSVGRYRGEIKTLDGVLTSAPEVRTKAGPVYLHCQCGTVNDSTPRQIRMPSGPGKRADENEDIVCQICDSPFTLSAGAHNPSGFQSPGPGRGHKVAARVVLRRRDAKPAGAG